MIIKICWLLCLSTNFLLFTNNNVPVSARTINPYIINGEVGSLNQFPWQARITFFTDYGQWYCGGTIINERRILTAAHCGIGFIIILVSVGNYSEINSYEFITHENFDPFTLKNDIATVVLEEDIIFNDIARPIDLGTEFLEENTDIVVSGYGADDSPSQLRYITLSTINNSDCKKTYGQNSIFPEMVCAVSKNDTVQATCFGDSGGPAVQIQNNTPVLVAVATFISDRGCESGDPSGFTRIGEYKSWIEKILK